MENIINELTIDDTTEIQNDEKADDTKNQTDDRIEVNELHHNVENHRSVSAIVQELQKELERPIMEVMYFISLSRQLDAESINFFLWQSWRPWPDLESPDADACGTLKHDNTIPTSNHAKPLHPLSDLTEEDQNLARHLSDMGFPLSRAARAIRDLGGEDNKKIVEYLLAVQSLEENGISGDDAEKALALTQYDQNKARIYYESLCTLRDLGFPEDEASVALLKCNIDRDRALDLLIAWTNRCRYSLNTINCEIFSCDLILRENEVVVKEIEVFISREKYRVKSQRIF